LRAPNFFFDNDQVANYKVVHQNDKRLTINLKLVLRHKNFKKDNTVDIDAMRKAVDDAGFSVAKLKITGVFNDVKVKNDAHVQIDGKTFHFLNVSNQTLNGEKTLVIADKDFISAKEFKKYSAATKMECLQTGKAGSCCTKEGIQENTRIYHVTI